MKVGVIYESTRGRTKAMAEAICEGVTSAGAECEVIDAKEFNGLGDICAVAIGSSTRMKRVLPKVKQIIAELTDLKGLPAAGFGSYGWSGEAPDEISNRFLKSIKHYTITSVQMKLRLRLDLDCMPSMQ